MWRPGPTTSATAACARTIMDEPVVLYRKADGKWRRSRIAARTASRRSPWARSSSGDRIQCPYHGLEFDGTGACVRNPHGAKNIPPRARVKAIRRSRSTRRSGSGWATAPADAAKVPDFGVLDNVPELHTTKRDRITIKANYQLIIDNLLDLSHTSYLHEGILGNADTVESESRPSRMATTWWSAAMPPIRRRPACSRQFWPNHPPRVDKFTSMRWMAPSTCG